MKKKATVISIVITLLLLLSSCASSSAAKSTEAYSAQVKDADAVVENYVEEDAVSGEENLAPEAAPDNQSSALIDPGNIPANDKKIIYTVNIGLESEDVKKAIESITDEATKLGGYVSDSFFQENNDQIQGSITVRIPPESLSAFTDKVGNAGKVLSSNMSSEDVSAQYVDLESRLSNAEAQERQLLDIMKQAVKIEDILYVRTELNTVQEEIEMIKGQLRFFDNLVGYSTVTITVTQPLAAPETPEVEPNSGVLAVWDMSFIQSNMQKAFTNSIAIVSMIAGGLLTLLSFLFIPALILAAIIVPIVFLVKASKKRKARKANK